MEVLGMRSRFGDLDYGADECEVQMRVHALENMLDEVIGQFIEEVDKDGLSDETLTAIALALDSLNATYWSHIVEWYGFPPEVEDQVYKNLITRVYKGSNGVLRKATSDHLRDRN
jgi:hypothetical protein